MKLQIIIIGLLSFVVLVLSVAALNREPAPSSGFLDERAMITVRSIGHRLLLSAGDSSSRVLPVRQLSRGIFQLEFQNRFSFVPDTLVSIVRANLASLQVPVNYLVNVFDCQSHDVVYAFEINPKKNDIVPCLGRSQPAGCYLIQIQFMEFQSEEHASVPYYFYITSLLSISLILFVGQTYYKSKKPVPSVVPADFVQIGKFCFYAESRLLKLADESIELSDKETKLLRIFAAQPNQLITRDQLLKEVWENEGVFTGRSLDMFISKLRKKLKSDPSIQLVNIHGLGYKLQID
jgi:hypothetical protein